MVTSGLRRLPNVGKTTLFNAVTAQSSALIANYAFSTSSRTWRGGGADERLAPLAKLVKTEVICSGSVEFVDITDRSSTRHVGSSVSGFADAGRNWLHSLARRRTRTSPACLRTRHWAEHYFGLHQFSERRQTFVGPPLHAHVRLLVRDA